MGLIFTLFFMISYNKREADFVHPSLQMPVGKDINFFGPFWRTS